MEVLYEKSLGGKDNYKNLIIIHKDIHILIHATKEETIDKYLKKFKFDKGQIRKINSLRKQAGNPPL